MVAVPADISAHDMYGPESAQKRGTAPAFVRWVLPDGASTQPHRSRGATVSRSERSAQATRPPLAALATDLLACSISRPSASKLSMMDIVDREADAERPRGG